MAWWVVVVGLGVCEVDGGGWGFSPPACLLFCEGKLRTCRVRSMIEKIIASLPRSREVWLPAGEPYTGLCRGVPAREFDIEVAFEFE